MTLATLQRTIDDALTNGLTEEFKTILDECLALGDRPEDLLAYIGSFGAEHRLVYLAAETYLAGK